MSKKIALLSVFILCVFAAGCNKTTDVENQCAEGEDCNTEVVAEEVLAEETEEAVTEETEATEEVVAEETEATEEVVAEETEEVATTDEF